MSDRDGSVCDADGNFYPEGRSLHSFTRYILYTFFPLELEIFSLFKHYAMLSLKCLFEIYISGSQKKNAQIDFLCMVA